MRLKEEKNRLDQSMHNQLGQSVVAAPVAASTVTINNNANANNTNTNSSNALSGTEVVVAPVTENQGNLW